MQLLYNYTQIVPDCYFKSSSLQMLFKVKEPKQPCLTDLSLAKFWSWNSLSLFLSEQTCVGIQLQQRIGPDLLRSAPPCWLQVRISAADSKSFHVDKQVPTLWFICCQQSFVEHLQYVNYARTLFLCSCLVTEQEIHQENVMKTLIVRT